MFYDCLLHDSIRHRVSWRGFILGGGRGDSCKTKRTFHMAYIQLPIKLVETSFIQHYTTLVEPIITNVK